MTELRIGLLAAALVGLGACGESPTGNGRGTPGIVVESGASVVDTIEAVLPDPLTIQVRGEDGRPLSGALVRLEAMAPPVGGTAEHRSVQIAAMGGEGFTPSMTVQTDASGRASVRVRMGRFAGTGGIVATVPALGYRTTAPFTVQPGEPAGTTLLPADIAVYVGTTVPLQGTVVDRRGNPRLDASYSLSAGPHVSVATGAFVAESLGRGYVLAHVGAAVDTAWVSVVPQGTLAVRDGRNPANGTRRSAFLLISLDGSVQSEFVPTSPGDFGLNRTEMAPDWSPAGDELVFYDGRNAIDLYIATMGGAIRQVTNAGTQQLIYADPHFSSDGEWIFYNRGQPASSSTEIWRVRRDGSEHTRITPLAASYQNDVDPSLSRDRAQMVFATDRGAEWKSFSLRIMTLATGAIRSLGVAGRQPEWSPTSNWIAFVQQGQVWVIRADGLGARRISGAELRYTPRLTWSPDGRWIAAAREGSGIDLIHVERGETLPLVFTADLSEPAWRP